jgi:putative two-component system response regulator
VADVFDAVTTRRPYREAFSNQEAYRILREGRGTQFDPRVVDVFFAQLDEVAAVQKPSIQSASVRSSFWEVA